MESNVSNGSEVLDKLANQNLTSLSLLELVVNLIFAFVGTSTTCLNALVIIGFVKEQRIREAPGNVFILNLAISDSLTGIFVCYVAILNLCKYQNDEEYLFRMGFVGAFLLASSFFLNFLTVDRYLKVTMHLRYLDLVTTRKHVILCAVTWMICIILGMLPLFGWHNPVVKSLSFFETFTQSYIIGIFSLGILPAFCMIYAYTRLYFVSRQHRRQIACLRQPKEGAIQVRKTRAIIRSIFLLIGAYLTCWLPIGIYSLVGASKGRDPNESSFPVFTLLVTMGFINSLLNPLIYATKVEEIREFFRKVCCCCKASGGNSSPEGRSRSLEGRSRSPDKYV